jgi:predicted outer membrane protein
VKAHQEVLDALDNKLIPNAQDASLKANLQQVRPTVAQHLKKGAALPERA